ncbi:hypothetical protein EYF80_063551 [Liparis tanakae]|uniref:Uncharacterized protein n=1 Tax=Liparis tanakae TaxID=230148 RepID=A0A4Z2EDG4_9TELE|nr:hypothetical protein EYF80_063551 [Liparis tanakae]
MVVAAPKATIANQLKKGTVQLNVLKGEGEVLRHGDAHAEEEERRVTDGVSLMFNPKEVILFPLHSRFITYTWTMQREITSVLQEATSSRAFCTLMHTS